MIWKLTRFFLDGKQREREKEREREPRIASSYLHFPAQSSSNSKRGGCNEAQHGMVMIRSVNGQPAHSKTNILPVESDNGTPAVNRLASSKGPPVPHSRRSVFL